MTENLPVHLQDFVSMLMAQRPEKILSSQGLYKVFAPLVLHPEKEQSAVAAMSASGRLIDVEVVAVGSHRFTVMDPTYVIRWVLTRKEPAISFAISHNHPAGSSRPSGPDNTVTMNIMRAADVVGLKFRDHIICADDGYFSFAEKGLI